MFHFQKFRNILRKLRSYFQFPTQKIEREVLFLKIGINSRFHLNSSSAKVRILFSHKQFLTRCFATFKMRFLILLALSASVSLVTGDEINGAKQVTCTLISDEFRIDGKTRNITTCEIKQQEIDTEEFSVTHEIIKTIVEGFSIVYSKEVKFLIENIAETFPNLVQYEVEFCPIKNINNNHFKNLFNLEKLMLGTNQIEKISKDSFKDLTSLKFLSLQHNKLKKFDSEWFKTLTNLETLGMHYNEVEELDAKICSELANLVKVDFTGNQLISIPANLFQKNFKLKMIELNYNKIQIINAAMFDHLTELRYVQLYGNECIDNMFYQQELQIMKDQLKENCNLIVKGTSNE